MNITLKHHCKGPVSKEIDGKQNEFHIREKPAVRAFATISTNSRKDLNSQHSKSEVFHEQVSMFQVSYPLFSSEI